MRTNPILATMMAIGGLLSATSPASAAAYTFTTLDVPGASFTAARGINDTGQIVGSFGDSTGQNLDFLYSDGTFTTLDVPGAAFTIASGINDAGQIVGTFGPPGPIGGHGFLYTGGNFTTLEVPGAANTSASGINDTGQIVGSFGPGGPETHGFLDTGGSFTTIDVPSAAGSTLAFGINDAGQITGYFVTGPRLNDIFGFLDTSGTFTTLDVPSSATFTEALGINSTGQIVGLFVDATGVEHGFLATPVSAVPEPSGLALVSVGLIGLAIRVAKGKGGARSLLDQGRSDRSRVWSNRAVSVSNVLDRLRRQIVSTLSRGASELIEARDRLAAVPLSLQHRYRGEGSYFWPP